MKKLGFLQKQLVVYSLLLLVAMLVLIFWAHSYLMDVSREKAVITQEQLTTAALEKVDAYLDQVMLIATQVAHDTEIVDYMQLLDCEENDPASNHFETDPEAQALLAEILARHNNPKAPVLAIDIHNERGDYICTDPTLEKLQFGVEQHCSDGIKWHMDKNFVTEKREFLMMGPFSRMNLLTGDDRVIFMIMPIKSPDDSEIYGYLRVYRSLKPLTDQLDMDHETGMDVYLFFEVSQARGEQFYPTDREFPDTSTGDYYETERRSHYWWYVVLLQNQKEFLASYQNMLFYLYLGGAALFLLLLICVYLLVRHMSMPILRLNDKVRAVSLDHIPDKQVVKEAANEVKQLETSFDAMMQRLKTSVELEKKAYLNALQAQMNPHFLYNCLSTISSMGIESHNEDIPAFCDHLAAILRYETIYEDKAVTLADELQNVTDFLELMKLRYEGDFTYDLTADESLLPMSMPRLTLQPIVENCFEHGFRSVTPPWHVSIAVSREDGRWCIRISDNGCGMDADTLHRLQEQVDSVLENIGDNYSDLKIGGLGLVNTIARLRLVSNDSLTYAITHNAPTGTVVTLRGAIYD